MIALALAYLLVSAVVLALVARTYGLRHPATTYVASRSWAPRVLPRLGPIVIGGHELRDSIDVSPTGLTYASPFERWQEQQGPAQSFGFAARPRPPANRQQRRRAAAIGGGR